MINPVDKTEDLTERLTDVQKIRFQEAVSDLATSAEQNVIMDDAAQVSQLWRKQFGNRFPEVLKKMGPAHLKQAASATAAYYIHTNPPKSWGI